jgi:hypothetical protein
MPVNKYTRRHIQASMNRADKIRGQTARLSNNDDRARRRAADLARFEERTAFKTALEEPEKARLEHAQRSAKRRNKFTLDSKAQRELTAREKAYRYLQIQKKREENANKLQNLAVARKAAKSAKKEDDDFGDLFSRMKMGGNKTRRNRGRSTRAKHPR